MKFHLLPGLICTLLILSAHSWWETGHMLVAEIAKQDLLKNNPEVYKRAEEISLFVKGLTGNLTDTFIESAIWLDDIKTEGWNALFTWHFVDRPYNPLGLVTNGISSYNAIYAIEEAINVLNNSKAYGKTTLTKSIFMRILCHVVGDIHQPLHGVSLYNLTFPLGDEGGNQENITVEAQNQKMPLHFYWDAIAFQLPNHFKRPLTESSTSEIEQLANKITDEFPKEGFKNQIEVFDLNQWTIDIFLDAIEYAYKPLRQDFVIDESYQKQAFHIMKRNIALAGFRLASVLEKALQNEVLTMKQPPESQLKVKSEDRILRSKVQNLRTKSSASR